MYIDQIEKFVICPYDSSHVLSQSKIQGHLWKCKEQHPNVKLATCFFNTTHLVAIGEMEKHLETCQDKMRLEGARYNNDMFIYKSQFVYYEDDVVSDSGASYRSNSLSKSGPLGNRPRHDVGHREEPCEEQINHLRHYDKVAAKTVFKPLPLPSTHSNAYAYHKQDQLENVESHNEHVKDYKHAHTFNYEKNFSKVFGRGNVLRSLGITKPGRKMYENLLPDISKLDLGPLPERTTKSKYEIILKQKTEDTEELDQFADDDEEDNVFIKSINRANHIDIHFKKESDFNSHVSGEELAVPSEKTLEQTWTGVLNLTRGRGITKVMGRGKFNFRGRRGVFS